MSGNLKYQQLSSSIPQKLPATASTPPVILSSDDYPIVQALNSVAKMTTSDPVAEYISVVSEDLPSRYDEVLANLKLYPKNLGYSRGDMLIQRKITGSYLQNNYQELIEGQMARGNILLAFDHDWIIPGIASFIMYHSDIKFYDIPTEAAVKFNIRQVTQVDITTRLTPEMIEIVPVTDTSLGGLSRYYLLFAPVTVIDAERIYLYLYRDFKLYSFFNYLAVKDCDTYRALDFQKLFPVVASTFKNFTIFQSSILSRSELVSIFYSGTITYTFPRLEPLIGCYAAYLLAEATEYKFTVYWQDSSLQLQDCGYIQSLDLRSIFCNLIKNIYVSDVVLTKVSKSHISELVVAGIKCFYYCGEYYGAIPKLYTFAASSTAADTFSEIEMVHPLRALSYPHLRPEGLTFLRNLGYQMVTTQPAPITNLNIEYVTVQQGSQLVTVYYYRTSFGAKKILSKIHGGHNQDIYSLLVKLLQLGWFFSAKGKNIVIGYPGYISSDSPINTSLSHQPDTLLHQLQSTLLSLTSK